MGKGGFIPRNVWIIDLGVAWVSNNTQSEVMVVCDLHPHYSSLEYNSVLFFNFRFCVMQILCGLLILASGHAKQCQCEFVVLDYRNTLNYFSMHVGS